MAFKWFGRKKIGATTVKVDETFAVEDIVIPEGTLGIRYMDRRGTVWVQFSIGGLPVKLIMEEMAIAGIKYTVVPRPTLNIQEW